MASAAAGHQEAAAFMSGHSIFNSEKGKGAAAQTTNTTKAHPSAKLTFTITLKMKPDKKLESTTKSQSDRNKEDEEYLGCLTYRDEVSEHKLSFGEYGSWFRLPEGVAQIAVLVVKLPEAVTPNSKAAIQVLASVFARRRNDDGALVDTHIGVACIDLIDLLEQKGGGGDVHKKKQVPKVLAILDMEGDVIGTLEMMEYVVPAHAGAGRHGGAPTNTNETKSNEQQAAVESTDAEDINNDTAHKLFPHSAFARLPPEFGDGTSRLIKTKSSSKSTESNYASLEDESTDRLRNAVRHAIVRIISNAAYAEQPEDSRNRYIDFVTPHHNHKKNNAVPLVAFVALARKIAELTVKPDTDGAAFALSQEPVEHVILGEDGKPHITTTTTGALITELFDHWAKLATVLAKHNRVGRPNDETEEARNASTLSEFLTLALRAMVYTPDKHKRVHGRTRMADFWQQILNFPSLGLAAFDCEDGALFVMQMCSMLYAVSETNLRTGEQNCSRLSDELATVCKTLRHYIPFFCVGELLTAPAVQAGPGGGGGSSSSSGGSSAGGGGASNEPLFVEKRPAQYSAHAFCILLPREEFATQYSKRLLQKKGAAYESNVTGESLHPTVDQPVFSVNLHHPYNKHPPLMVESTTYSDSVWTATAAMARWNADAPFVHQLSPLKWNEWMRYVPLENGKDEELREFLRRGVCDGVHTQHENGFRISRTVKTRAPIGSLYSRGMYRRVFAMMTPFAELYSCGDKVADRAHCNASAARYEYFVLTQRPAQNSTTFQYGAHLHDLMFPPRVGTGGQGGDDDTGELPAAPKLHSVQRIYPADVNTPKANFEYMLSDIPAARFPRPANDANIPHVFKELKRVGPEHFTSVEVLANKLAPNESIVYLAPSYDFLVDDEFGPKMMEVLRLYWSPEGAGIKAYDVRLAHSVTLRVITVTRKKPLNFAASAKPGPDRSDSSEAQADARRFSSSAGGGASAVRNANDKRCRAVCEGTGQ